MYYKKGLFENVQGKQAIIKNIEKDYLSGKTIKEISEDYSFNQRQVRYIIEHYLKINRKEYKGKEKKCMVEESNGETIKIDKDNYLIDGKPAKKATVQDLVEKAKLARKEMKKKSTNKKVENNN